MDFNKMTLFAAMKKRMAWLTQRQQVIAHNIANSDTPGFKATDLKGFNFTELVRRENMQINMVRTGAQHLGGNRRAIRDFAERQTRHPYETAPAGNSVVLEEQMMKINETSAQHKLMNELYKKHMGLLRVAITKN
jgi:flagellar basal-body rod protein FlgB